MVDISPDGGIFGIFRNLNYKPWYALGEFVDNAVSAWEKWDNTVDGIPRPSKVRVEIEIGTSGSEPFIEVRDNASGIALKDFDSAFKVATPPADTSGLNEFGMGMKTAAFWFSNNWTVRTSFAGEGIARTMRFDLDRILSNTSKNLEIFPEESPTKDSSHFTTIRLVNLNQMPKGRTIGRIKEHLTDIYRVFITEGTLELVYNGELLTYSSPTIMHEPAVSSPESPKLEWKKNFDFHLDSTGRRIHGWVALRNPGSTSLAGFALFRKKRLIVGSSDETYRPSRIFKNSNSFTWQRLIGDVHLDPKIKVTHTKDGFLWAETEEDEFISKMLEILKDPSMDFITQAENYRRRGDKVDPKRVENALDTLRATLEQSIPNSIEAISPSKDDIDLKIPETITEDKDQANLAKNVELRIDTTNHGLWLVKLTVVQNEAVTNFFKIGLAKQQSDGQGRSLTHLEVSVNLAHPFVERYVGPSQENSEVIIAFAASLAVALSLGRSVGANSGYIIDYLNDVLRFGGVK
ncbi:MAG: hypothetical protein RL036_26 [Actinomycetota bacterium]|jgi:hypothetical protein